MNASGQPAPGSRPNFGNQAFELGRVNEWQQIRSRLIQTNIRKFSDSCQGGYQTRHGEFGERDYGLK
jgi:hypothetical protein